MGVLAGAPNPTGSAGSRVGIGGLQPLLKEPKGLGRENYYYFQNQGTLRASESFHVNPEGSGIGKNLGYGGLLLKACVNSENIKTSLLIRNKSEDSFLSQFHFLLFIPLSLVHIYQSVRV